jgi:ATP-dependent 26S proteasome regulatory subunit
MTLINTLLRRSLQQENSLMTAKKKAPELATTLVDPAVPIEQRKQVLLHVCMDPSPESQKTLQIVLDAAATAKGEDLWKKKIEELDEKLREMEAGALRHATFIKMINPKGVLPRAHVLLQDGTAAFTVVPDPQLVKQLQCGDTVLLEATGKALLFRDIISTDTGEEAKLERRIDGDRVEVSIRDQERHVYRTSQKLTEKLDSQEVSMGGTLLVCTRRAVAFDAIPKQDGHSHYRYLALDAVPDVLIDRDIGSPPVFLNRLASHIGGEMDDPSLGRKYRRRRSKMTLLTGVSGSGKTLCIQGLWRRMYEVMSERTGVPIEQLPPRVLKLRMSEVLSKWLGESDKQLDRFFDEVEQLADEKFIAPDGTEWTLPVLAIGEEVDSVSRARGSDVEATYDRIQTTALQRLDTTCQKLRDQLVLFMFTTNVPHLVDPAFLRRAGGTIERFGRLSQRSFVAVLTKHLRDLPLFTPKPNSKTPAAKQVIGEVNNWLFCPKAADLGQAEITFAGSTTPVTKFRRDFLTGALIDRAVQEAADEACQAERDGCDQPGVTARMIIAALDQQVRGIVEQLHLHNVANYLTLPDGVRVTNVKKLEQPTVLPFDLERAS